MFKVGVALVQFLSLLIKKHKMSGGAFSVGSPEYGRIRAKPMSTPLHCPYQLHAIMPLTSLGSHRTVTPAD